MRPAVTTLCQRLHPILDALRVTWRRAVPRLRGVWQLLALLRCRAGQRRVVAAARDHGPAPRDDPARSVRGALASSGSVAAALALIALVYRVLLLRTALGTVDSDQAVLGIMARHILRGEHPVFFYGQGYQGALEAYLTAFVFRLWGQSDLTLRLVPVLVSVLLVVQLYALARRLYGRRVALITGLWLAVPAPVLVYWSTAAGAGYAEAMALGNGLMAIAIRRWGLGQPRRYDVPALGLLAGLGVWVHPVISYYLGALLLAGAPLAWRRLRAQPDRAVLWRARPALVLFALGAGPWLGYTLVHGGSTFSIISGRPNLASLPDAAWRLATEALPVLFGGALPDTLADEFVGYANGHMLPYAMVVLALGYMVVRVAVSPGGWPAQGRALLAGRPLADAPLALLPLVTIVLYLASRFEALSWTTHNPRYLLPLYTATPYLVACAVPTPPRAATRRRPRRWTAAAPHAPYLSARLRAATSLYRDGAGVLVRWAPGGALGLLLAVNVYGAAQYQYQAPPRVAPLAAMLLSRGDTAIYCLYWLAWRLAFESGERLTPVVTHGLDVDPRPAGNRYPPYLAQAARARRWAYILPYDVGAPALEARLQRQGVPYAQWRWGNASVFDGPVQWDFPPAGVIGSAQGTLSTQTQTQGSAAP